MRLSRVCCINLFRMGFVLCYLLCFFSCNNDEISKVEVIEEFSLEKEHDSLYFLNILSAKKKDRWKLSYPVYRFYVGDIDENGKNDALIGVVKKTRFDSVFGKRVFIFKNYKELIRPLWLGSKFGQPLVDFSYVETRKGARIRTIEKEKNGNFLVAEYKWRKFGVEFTKYIKREIDSVTAYALLKQ